MKCLSLKVAARCQSAIKIVQKEGVQIEELEASGIEQSVNRIQETINPHITLEQGRVRDCLTKLGCPFDMIGEIPPKPCLYFPLIRNTLEIADLGDKYAIFDYNETCGQTWRLTRENKKFVEAVMLDTENEGYNMFFSTGFLIHLSNLSPGEDYDQLPESVKKIHANYVTIALLLKNSESGCVTESRPCMSV